MYREPFHPGGGTATRSEQASIPIHMHAAMKLLVFLLGLSLVLQVKSHSTYQAEIGIITTSHISSRCLYYKNYIIAKFVESSTFEEEGAPSEDFLREVQSYFEHHQMKKPFRTQQATESSGNM